MAPPPPPPLDLLLVGLEIAGEGVKLPELLDELLLLEEELELEELELDELELEDELELLEELEELLDAATYRTTTSLLFT